MAKKKKKSNILYFPGFHPKSILSKKLFKELVKLASDMETSKNKFEKLEDKMINKILSNIKFDGLATRKDYAGIKEALIEFHEERIKKIRTKIKTN